MNLKFSRNSLLNNLTILIPTYNRHSYIYRCIKYWSNQNIRVLIVDGSPKSLDKKKILEAGSNIYYYHLPVSLYKRYLFGVRLVKTDYAIFGTDDEFFLISALNSCLLELSKNDDLISCGGLSIRYEFEDDMVFGFNCYSKLRNKNLDNNTSKHRLKKHFCNYAPAHFYSICKTKIWKAVTEDIFSYEYNFYSAPEIQFEYLMSYAGKSKIIPELMFLRSNENKPIRQTSSSMDIYKTRRKWWFRNKYSREKYLFFKKMKSSCKKINYILEKEDKPYFRDLIKEQFLKSKRGLIFDFFYSVYLKIPAFIRRGKNVIFNFLNLKFSKKKSLIDRAKLLENTGVRVNFVELKSIEQIIRLHHKK